MNLQLSEGLEIESLKHHLTAEGFHALKVNKCYVCAPNQAGFDVVCKLNNLLLLIEAKWSDANSETYVNEREVREKLHKCQDILQEIGWPEDKTVWILAAWRKFSLQYSDDMLNFGGHVVILDKTELQKWLGPTFEQVPAFELSSNSYFDK